MFKINPSQKRLPIGGHHFPYKEYHVTFKGDTLQSVIQKLEAFRLNNQIPIGDPEQDVLLYYGQNWPYMVLPDESRIAAELPGNYGAWRKWIMDSWRKPVKKFVATKEAQARWEICKDCPFNVALDWDETNESAELTRRAFILRRGIETPDYVGFCKIHKWDIATAGFIDNVNEFSNQDERPFQKCDSCWASGDKQK